MIVDGGMFLAGLMVGIWLTSLYYTAKINRDIIKRNEEIKSKSRS